MTDEALKPLFISQLPYFVQVPLSARFTEPLPQLVREADKVAGFNTQALRPFLSQNPAELIGNAVSSKNSPLEAQHENALLKKQNFSLKKNYVDDLEQTNMLMVGLNLCSVTYPTDD